MRIEDRIRDELERLPNHFTEELQVRILKSVPTIRPRRNIRHLVGGLTAVAAGLAVCAVLTAAVVVRPVPQPNTTSKTSTGASFGTQLMSEIYHVAARDQRTFQVYIPTGGFNDIKVPALQSWTSGANEFAVEISEKSAAKSPDYNIDEMPYAGPVNKSSFTKIGTIDGVVVYEHKFSPSTVVYTFRIGYTSFNVTATTMLPGQRSSFPKGMITHLIKYPAKGLIMPTSAKHLNQQAVEIAVPNSHTKSRETWQVVKDPGGLPAVQVSYDGKAILLLSVPAINTNLTTEYVLVDGINYKVSHIVLSSHNKSATVTLLRAKGWR